MTAADYAGIVSVIASVTTAIVTIVTLIRQGAIKESTDTKLQELHAMGNSNLEKAQKLSEALGVEKGKQIGAEFERANPLTPNQSR